MDTAQLRGMTNHKRSGLAGSKKLLLSGSAGLKKITGYQTEPGPGGGLDFAAHACRNGANAQSKTGKFYNKIYLQPGP